MPEAEAPTSSTPDGNTPSAPTSTAGDEFKPITSQAEFDAALKPRLERERSKFADYKDVKAKASQLDAIEQANKSEIDKAMDRVTKAEAEVATVPSKVAEALREHLVSLHQINDDDAELFLTATDPALLLKQVERLTGRVAEQTAEQRRNGNHVPREGANPPAGAGDDREAVRAIFGTPT